MKKQPQLNVRKAALYSIVINALQIIAVCVLAVFILHDGINQSLHGPTGDIVVVEGKLVIDGISQGLGLTASNWLHSAIGAVAGTRTRTITVQRDAELEFRRSSTTGTYNTPQEWRLVVDGGTLTLANRATTGFGTLELNNATFKYIVYGGSSEKAGSLVVTKDYEKLLEVINSESKFTDKTCAAPVSYTARFLKDGRIASSNIATDYIETTSVTRKSIPLRIFGTGINGRMHSGKVKVEGEKIIGFNEDGTRKTEKIVIADVKLENTGTATKSPYIPADVDLRTVTVSFDYEGRTSPPPKTARTSTVLTSRSRAPATCSATM